MTLRSRALHKLLRRSFRRRAREPSHRSGQRQAQIGWTVDRKASLRGVALVLLIGSVTACGPRPWGTAGQLPPQRLNAPPVRARVAYRAMGLMKVSLRSAVERALRGNAGFRAVSVTPSLKDGRAVADVTLAQGAALKTVPVPLD